MASLPDISMKTILIPLLALAAGTAAAQSGLRPDDNVAFAYADVLRADPVYEVVRFTEPREECQDRPVTYREEGRQPVGGTVLGAIIGGVLGSQVGSGSGRNAATIAGAVAGGAVGRQADRRRTEPDRYYDDVETRCRVVEVERQERRVAGYDVEYQSKGDVFCAGMPYVPGSKLRVRVTVEPAD